MRCVPIAALILMLSSAAIAQTPSPSGAAPPTDAVAASPADGISRDDYIAKARDAAAKRAATRFDAMDANHDGGVSGTAQPEG